MSHKLYKIKTNKKKKKIQQRFPSNMETKVSTVTPRQTVTPNKDIAGEEREDVNRLNKGEATVVLYSVCVCVSVYGWDLIMMGVYPVIRVHPRV